MLNSHIVHILQYEGLAQKNPPSSLGCSSPRGAAGRGSPHFKIMEKSEEIKKGVIKKFRVVVLCFLICSIAADLGSTYIFFSVDVPESGLTEINKGVVASVQERGPIGVFFLPIGLLIFWAVFAILSATLSSVFFAPLFKGAGFSLSEQFEVSTYIGLLTLGGIHMTAGLSNLLNVAYIIFGWSLAIRILGGIVVILFLFGSNHWGRWIRKKLYKPEVMIE